MVTQRRRSVRANFEAPLVLLVPCPQSSARPSVGRVLHQSFPWPSSFSSLKSQVSGFLGQDRTTLDQADGRSGGDRRNCGGLWLAVGREQGSENGKKGEEDLQGLSFRLSINDEFHLVLHCRSGGRAEFDRLVSKDAAQSQADHGRLSYITTRSPSGDFLELRLRCTAHRTLVGSLTHVCMSADIADIDGRSTQILACVQGF
jgi:hypothetical protein